jgi:dolichyl-phosphate beta-glucosyltransferase
VTRCYAGPLVARSALSVVVPAYNEEHRLPALLAALEREFDSILESTSTRLVEVLVVDDGSTDRTAEVVRSFSGLRGRLSLISLPVNRGKGAAVRAGMLAARGERALMTDADMSTPLADTVPLSRALDDGADIAIGSRALEDSRVLVHQPLVRELMGKGFNLLLRLSTDIPWRDTQCGFKLFSLQSTRVLFQAQRIEGFAFDAELCVNARRLGLRLVEVPVRWVDDPDTRVRLARSSSRMALDGLRIASIARRKWVAPPGSPPLEPSSMHVSDSPVVPVGLSPHGKTLGA